MRYKILKNIIPIKSIEKNFYKYFIVYLPNLHLCASKTHKVVTFSHSFPPTKWAF